MIDPVSTPFSPLQVLRQQCDLERLPGVAQPGLQRSAGVELPLAVPKDADRADFSSLVGGLVRAVDDKARAADSEVRKLMLGESDNLHRAMIAMQESGVSFKLLVEVRNKLIESYQELMRMPV